MLQVEADDLVAALQVGEVGGSVEHLEAGAADAQRDRLAVLGRVEGSSRPETTSVGAEIRGRSSSRSMRSIAAHDAT